MGLPYSKQINAAFEQVTPLVAAGFKVLQTTKNISLLLAVIQVLTVLILACILAVLFAVLICVNPDLSAERDALVTPAVRVLARCVMGLLELRNGFVWVVTVVGMGVAVGALWGLWYTARDPTLRIDEQGAEVGRDGGLTGEDIEAIKKGGSKQ